LSEESLYEDISMLPRSLQREVNEDFASFVVGLDEYSYISTLDVRSTMNQLDNGFIIKQMCTFANTCHLYSFTSGKLFIGKKELEHLQFYSLREAQQVGFAKIKYLGYVHSNLFLVSRRGEEYTSWPLKIGMWIMNPLTWTSLSLH
jgi:hypothetical protein